MATQKKCEIAIDFEEHIKDLLECPVCIEPILSAPIHQCTNAQWSNSVLEGHFRILFNLFKF